MPTDEPNQRVNAARAEDDVTIKVLPPRSERYFKLADDWYFTTRENVTMGPFERFEHAQYGVTNFIDFIHTAPPKIIEVFKGY